MGSLLKHVLRTQTAKPPAAHPLRYAMPAPVKGWNTRDSIAAMDPGYAVRMDNWFPDLGHVKTRKGYELYAETGSAEPVETIVEHFAPGVRRLFAATSQGVYDITDPPPREGEARTGVSQALPTSIASGRWDTANFNANTIWVNGVDQPLRLDQGGNWAPHGYTGDGLDPATLKSAVVHQHRLFFTAAGSSDIWYGGLNAVTGPLGRFPIGLIAEEAGDAVAIGSISMDTGRGVDDMLAVLMERGQVVLFQGTNPDDADSWRMVGVFHLAPIVGDRPMVKLGGDLVIITGDGFLPLLQFIRGGREQTDLAISDPIAPSVAEAVRDGVDPDGGTLFGWQAELHTPSKWLLFNVPLPGFERFEQYVMNIQTKAWCRFTGMNARCWTSTRDGLFFGDAEGKVMRADVGGVDGRPPGIRRPNDGEAIQTAVRSAYTYCDVPNTKIFQQLRMHLESQQDATILRIGWGVDFGSQPITLSSGRVEDVGRRWSTDGWNRFKWSSGVDRIYTWLCSPVKGTAVAVHIESVQEGQQTVWRSTDLLYNVLPGAGGV